MCAALWAGSALAVEQVYPEPTERTFPTLSSLDGAVLAEGEEVEEVFGDRVEVRARYHFIDGREVEESVRLRQVPELAQESWDWKESVPGGAVSREFHVDFLSGNATAFKQARRWSERLRVIPGQTFGGPGFVLALRNLQPRLDRGEVVKLLAVAFTPAPRLVNVSLRGRGAEQLRSGGRTWTADHFTLHPDLSFWVGLVAQVSDFEFYFSTERPPDLLRAEISLLEPGDPRVRADTFGVEARGRPRLRSGRTAAGSPSAR